MKKLLLCSALLVSCVYAIAKDDTITITNKTTRSFWVLCKSTKKLLAPGAHVDVMGTMAYAYPAVGNTTPSSDTIKAEAEKLGTTMKTWGAGGKVPYYIHERSTGSYYTAVTE